MKGSVRQRVQWVRCLKRHCTLIAVAYLVLLSTVGSASSLASEIQIKANKELLATFVFKFIEFVTLKDFGDSRVSICVVGDETDLAAFQRFHGKTVGDRTVSVRNDPQEDNGKSCSIAYFALENAALLGALQASGTLTVGLGSQFIDNGGVIALVEENNRIRFEVSVASAKREGLEMSSRFMQLAKIRK
ncbi:MAG: YfiR family protein [Bdellovibrionales bacterium]|nr:YfiR family protein [Bdellovibrionales bacterium]